MLCLCIVCLRVFVCGLFSVRFCVHERFVVCMDVCTHVFCVRVSKCVVVFVCMCVYVWAYVFYSVSASFSARVFQCLCLCVDV